MLIVMVELLIAVLTVAVAALLSRWAWITRRRGPARQFISEAQARENAAPLTTAIVTSDRRERAGE